MTDKPATGTAVQLADGLVSVLAPNPSPMTYWGTNSYIIGHDSVAVIDPGPADDAHLQALLGAIGGRRVSHILVTHSHLDHSPLARALSDATDAPVFGFGDSNAGRSDIMNDLAMTELLGGGEGVDAAFDPDERLADGDEVSGDGWSLRALHTPGHFGNHLCFLWDDVAFCGDLVMGWATSLVSPPDGDLTDFMASCRALAATGITRAYSGHGAPIHDAQARIGDLIAHRQGREASIRAALAQGGATPKALTQAIYTDIAPALLPLAERNVLAHLIDLVTRGIATPQGPLSARAKFILA